MRKKQAVITITIDQDSEGIQLKTEYTIDHGINDFTVLGAIKGAADRLSYNLIDEIENKTKKS